VPVAGGFRRLSGGPSRAYLAAMRRRDENILTVLAQVPWWISVIIAGVVYVVLKFVIPSIWAQDPIFKFMALAAGQLAWVAVIFLFPAAVSAIESLRKGRLLDQQSGIESIRSLSWKEFEEMVAEAYRRQGYAVRENFYAGPDGGIDLTLEKGGEVLLVQCKRWRVYNVGVGVVREILGLITAHRATGGIVVTCGQFTQEAKSFAARNGIELLEGRQLVELLRGVQAHPAPAVGMESLPPPMKACPRCGSELVLRTARRGQRAGGKFWGCSSYSRCKHTEEHQG
jgi:restriction system protein